MYLLGKITRTYCRKLRERFPQVYFTLTAEIYITPSDDVQKIMCEAHYKYKKV